MGDEWDMRDDEWERLWWTFKSLLRYLGAVLSRGLRLGDMVAEKLEVDSISFNTVLDACGSGGMWQLAWRLLGSMQRRVPRVPPTVISFNAAISACSTGGLWPQGLYLLRDMTSRGLLPDAVTSMTSMTSLALDASGTMGWPRVLALLAARRELQLDLIALQAVTAVLSSAEQWQSALILLEASEASGHGEGNGAALAVRCSSWPRALALAACMSARRLQMDPLGTGIVASSMEKGWQWQPALQLLKNTDLQSLQRSSFVLSPVASACEKSACWQEALGLVAARHRYLPVQSTRSTAKARNKTFKASKADPQSPEAGKRETGLRLWA